MGDLQAVSFVSIVPRPGKTRSALHRLLLDVWPEWIEGPGCRDELPECEAGKGVHTPHRRGCLGEDPRCRTDSQVFGSDFRRIYRLSSTGGWDGLPPPIVGPLQSTLQDMSTSSERMPPESSMPSRLRWRGLAWRTGTRSSSDSEVTVQVSWLARTTESSPSCDIFSLLSRESTVQHREWSSLRNEQTAIAHEDRGTDDGPVFILQEVNP